MRLNKLSAKLKIRSNFVLITMKKSVQKRSHWVNREMANTELCHPDGRLQLSPPGPRSWFPGAACV